MSIDYYIGSGWKVTCDRCGHQVTISSAAIKLEQALFAVATGQGWYIAERVALRKQGDDLCPDCAVSSREGRIRALEVRIAQLEWSLLECGGSEVLEHGQICYGCERTVEELQDLEAEVFYLRKDLDGSCQ